MGMLAPSLVASAPSDSTQPASPLTPASLSSTESGTPVHSLQAIIPCIWSSVFSSGARGIRYALDVVRPRDGRQPHQLFQREHQRPVHHAVDRETVLPRIDVRRVVAVRGNVVQRRRRDGAGQLRQRRPRVEAVRVAVQIDVADHGHRRAHRLHETRALAVRHRMAGDSPGARRPQAPGRSPSLRRRPDRWPYRRQIPRLP